MLLSSFASLLHDSFWLPKLNVLQMNAFSQLKKTSEVKTDPECILENTRCSV